MANLTFADFHNMVAYMEKSAKNADFVEIVDFLNAKPIRLERAATTTTSLDAKHDSGTIIRTQSTTIPNEPIPQGTGLGGSPRCQDTILGDKPAQTRFERLSKQSHEPPLSRVNTLRSGEDRMQLMELMALCTTLSDRVLALENNKTAQELEFTHLKKRVKRLEKKRKSRTPQLKRRLFKVRKEYSAEKSLGDQEDASKQEKNDQDERISFVQENAEIQERYGHDNKINTASTSITTASINITTAEPVTTVSTPITTAGVSVMRNQKKKAKQRGSKEKYSETATRPAIGVILREASKTTTRPTVPPQHLLDPKDKGKVKMVEPEKPLKKKDQIEFDKKVAQRLHSQFEEEENIAEWDDVQAIMDAALKKFKRILTPMSWINSFIPIDKEKLDEKVEAEVDNDQEETDMKMYMKIVPDDEIAIDAISLATKPSIIVDWKIIKEGKISPYHIKRVDGSSKRQEEAYERVLWGNLKVMFELDLETQHATDDSPAVLKCTVVETLLNISPENKAHYDSEKEAIHLLLTRIEEEIYSTVDACKTAHKLWIAIERLQYGESLNIQDVKTNLFWEFDRFTSHNGESMESYCTRFYKMIDEMIRNNSKVATMQVNVQFP
uniref:Reverse transcriptase domain-containing protein n=1 Tax=Tanacetum cinerariifolium TaxID=118510 RepID=A0A6L2K8Z1_TANCI|nr:hypothetical protein [Tanacetum cinerariifolium]